MCILSDGCSNFLHQPSRERKKKQNKRFLVRKRLVTERFYHEQGKHYRGYYYKTCYFGLSQNEENKNLKNTKISINWMKSWIFVTVFQTCTGKWILQKWLCVSTNNNFYPYLVVFLKKRASFSKNKHKLSKRFHVY